MDWLCHSIFANVEEWARIVCNGIINNSSILRLLNCDCMHSFGVCFLVPYMLYLFLYMNVYVAQYSLRKIIFLKTIITYKIDPLLKSWSDQLRYLCIIVSIEDLYAVFFIFLKTFLLMVSFRISSVTICS